MDKTTITSQRRSTSKADSFLISFSDLPIGLMLIDANAIVVEANSNIFKYLMRNDLEKLDRRFGNLFNCNVAVSENIECGTGIPCQTCEINQGVHQVLSEGQELKEVELSHNFIMNGREGIKWFAINAKRIFQKGKAYALVAFTDISNRKKIENELVKLGILDELTGLYNRRYIIQQFETILNTYSEERGPSSVALLDLDEFKEINDTFGHNVGDEVLICFSKLMQSVTRETEIVGRYGGDEFLLIFTNSDSQAANKILLRILEQSKNLMKDKFNIQLTFSAGLVEIKSKVTQDDSTKAIIEKVDRLLYLAKETGRNRIELDSTISCPIQFSSNIERSIS